MNARIIPLVFVIAIGCGKKDKRPDDDLTNDTQHVTEAGPPSHADPGPALRRRTGAQAPLARPTVQAQVDRIEKQKGYVLATIPLPEQGMPNWDTNTQWSVEAGDQHVVGFRWSGPDLKDPKASVAGVIVRAQGSALPDAFTIRWAQTDYHAYGAKRRPGMVGTIEVTTPSNVAKAKGLNQAFWDSAAQAFERTSRAPFYAYAAHRARYFANGGEAPSDVQGVPNPRRSDLHQIMDLYTGMTSVNEALQSDRALLMRAEPKRERTVPIADVKRLELTAHPWDQMIAELGQKPKVEPIAKSVPADMGYVHFGDMRTFVKLIRDLDGWVSPVAQWVEGRAGASHFMSRYEEQLILERTGVAETLGHVAVKDLAVVVSDPFLREGTDVTMVFRVANRAAMLTALSAFQAEASRRHDDLQTKTLELDGTKVERRFTPGGAVNQYRAEIGDLLVLSNSPGAVSRILKAHTGKVPRLSDQGDFRYMRAIYPYAEDEAGFVFLGDAFVARAVSPELKILETRRMEARADLQAINHAALLRGWVDGAQTKTIEELVTTGFVEKGELLHADTTSIAFSPDLGANSEHGTVARLQPIRDMKIDKVTQAESDAYDRFRDTYQSYWRNYIDPIGARIERSEDGKRLSVDARMLPLIDASEYDELLRQVGKKKILPAAKGPGLEWTLAIGDDARLRRELDGLAKGFIPGDNIGIDWLGDWVSVGVADRGGLWDMALITGMIPSTEEAANDMRAGLGVLSSFPLYAAVHVGSSIGLAALLTGLKKWVGDSAPGMVTWGASEPYRDIPIVTITGNQSDRELQDVAIHYANVNDVFVISFNHATLLTLIDRYLAGDGPEIPKGPPSSTMNSDTQATLSLDAGPNGWLTQTVMGVAESEIIRHHGGVMDDIEVLWRGIGNLDQRALRDHGVAFLGYEPRSPHGGTFSVVDGFITHSIYGDNVRPVMPDVPLPDSPITDVLSRVQRLNMTVEFDGEAEHRGLHTTMEWIWKD